MNAPFVRCLIAVSPVLLLLAGAAEAGRHGPPRWAPGAQKHYPGPVAYARVTGVRPLFDAIATQVPVRECYETAAYYPPARSGTRSQSAVGPTIAGGVIGGVIGDRFGSGEGRDAMRLFGALVGAAIGNDMATRRQGGYYAPGPAASYPVTECVTRYETRVEQVSRGYEVTYVYQGQQYVTHTATPPGKKIPVEVYVRPI